MPAVYSSLPLLSTGNTHGIPYFSVFRLRIPESSGLPERKRLPVTACFRHISLPFPADEKFTRAIPMNFASLLAFGKRLIFPISDRIYAAVIMSIPGMVISVQWNSGRMVPIAWFTSSNWMR